MLFKLVLQDISSISELLLSQLEQLPSIYIYISHIMTLMAANSNASSLGVHFKVLVVVMVLAAGLGAGE